MTLDLISSREDMRAIEARPYSAFMPFADLFDALEATARRHPDRTALRYLHSADPDEPPATWTYSAFVAGVARAASLFHDLAAGEEPRVAMLLPAIPSAYFTLWGGEAAGVVCPINHLLDAGHIAGLIRASGANILVALGPNPDLDIWSRIPEITAVCPGLKQILSVGAVPGFRSFDEALEQQPVHERWRRAPDPKRLAALFHTGGTTGAPKLAQHTHGNQLHSAWGAARMYAMQPEDRILNGFPLFHVAGAFVYGLSALLSGAEVVLPTLLGLRNTEFVKRYWQFVERERVTLLAAVPTVFATLLAIDPGASGLKSVRALLTGGSPLPADLAAAFEKRFGMPVRNILGMTECAGVVSIEPFAAPRTPGCCGLPLPFVDVQALGPDGAPCAPGESGVLRLRGPNVGPGYTDPARDAGTFDDGWLNTGDIGHVDAQGRVFVTGRAKDVIIRGGHNIDPQLIEEALLQHPDVLIAAAVGAPDAYAGELPVAFVALKPGATEDVESLMAVARRHIPERPAWPRRIDVLPGLPITAIGKIYKPALRALACQRVMMESVQAAGLGDCVGVRVEDAASGLLVHFALHADADSAQVRAALAGLMQPFALRWEVTP